MIRFMDLHSVNKRFNKEFNEAYAKFLDSGRYILGSEVKNFENNFSLGIEEALLEGTLVGLLGFSFFSMSAYTIEKKLIFFSRNNAKLTRYIAKLLI